MNPTIAKIVEIEDKALELVAQAQAPVVEYVGKAASAVADRLPSDRPALPVDPAEVVESQFTFATKALKAQHDFVTALLGAVAPVLGTSVPAKKRAVKAA